MSLLEETELFFFLQEKIEKPDFFFGRMKYVFIGNIFNIHNTLI